MMTASSTRAQFIIERIYDTTLEEAWALWTTKEGIESWWGPEGFDVSVLALDLRAGGGLLYRMTATGADQIAFMKRAGMPLSTDCKISYTDVSPPQKLGYTTMADFIPNVAPYEVATLVELKVTTAGVKMLITFDAMHEELWTERARAGHESQLSKLDKLLARRGGTP